MEPSSCSLEGGGPIRAHSTSSQKGQGTPLKLPCTVDATQTHSLHKPVDDSATEAGNQPTENATTASTGVPQANRGHDDTFTATASLTQPCRIQKGRSKPPSDLEAVSLNALKKHSGGNQPAHVHNNRARFTPTAPLPPPPGEAHRSYHAEDEFETEAVVFTWHLPSSTAYIRPRVPRVQTQIPKPDRATPSSAFHQPAASLNVTASMPNPTADAVQALQIGVNATIPTHTPQQLTTQTAAAYETPRNIPVLSRSMQQPPDIPSPSPVPSLSTQQATGPVPTSQHSPLLSAPLPVVPVPLSPAETAQQLKSVLETMMSARRQAAKQKAAAPQKQPPSKTKPDLQPSGVSLYRTRPSQAPTDMRPPAQPHIQIVPPQQALVSESSYLQDPHISSTSILLEGQKQSFGCSSVPSLQGQAPLNINSSITPLFYARESLSSIFFSILEEQEAPSHTVTTTGSSTPNLPAQDQSGSTTISSIPTAQAQDEPGFISLDSSSVPCQLTQPASQPQAMAPPTPTKLVAYQETGYPTPALSTLLLDSVPSPHLSAPAHPSQGTHHTTELSQQESLLEGIEPALPTDPCMQLHPQQELQELPLDGEDPLPTDPRIRPLVELQLHESLSQGKEHVLPEDPPSLHHPTQHLLLHDVGSDLPSDPRVQLQLLQQSRLHTSEQSPQRAQQTDNTSQQQQQSPQPDHASAQQPHLSPASFLDATSTSVQTSSSASASLFLSAPVLPSASVSIAPSQEAYPGQDLFLMANLPAQLRKQARETARRDAIADRAFLKKNALLEIKAAEALAKREASLSEDFLALEHIPRVRHRAPPVPQDPEAVAAAVAKKAAAAEIRKANDLAAVDRVAAAVFTREAAAAKAAEIAARPVVVVDEAKAWAEGAARALKGLAQAEADNAALAASLLVRKLANAERYRARAEAAKFGVHYMAPGGNQQLVGLTRTRALRPPTMPKHMLPGYKAPIPKLFDCESGSKKRKLRRAAEKGSKRRAAVGGGSKDGDDGEDGGDGGGGSGDGEGEGDEAAADLEAVAGSGGGSEGGDEPLAAAGSGGGSEGGDGEEVGEEAAAVAGVADAEDASPAGVECLMDGAADDEALRQGDYSMIARSGMPCVEEPPVSSFPVLGGGGGLGDINMAEADASAVAV